MLTVIANLEQSVHNTSLLNGDSAQHDQYFSEVFNGVLATYIEMNRKAIRVDGEGAGKERNELFSTFLAYIPDLADERYYSDAILHHKPHLRPLSKSKLRERIEDLVEISHDGFIGWDSKRISNNYLSFADIAKAAKAAADKRTGRKSKSVLDAIRPFLGPAFLGPNREQLTVGLKTLNGALAPLAIPGCVTYSLKCTVHKHGIGRVLMFDRGGLSIEGYLDVVPGQPRDLYFMPSNDIVIVRQEYMYDKDKRQVIPTERSMINPKRLGITPMR